jgi:hypothetical protein
MCPGRLWTRRFLITVQARRLWIVRAPGDYNNCESQPDLSYKRDGGQFRAGAHSGR